MRTYGQLYFDDNDVKKSAEILKKYCSIHTDCSNCMFERHSGHPQLSSYCGLFKFPRTWRIGEKENG